MPVKALEVEPLLVSPELVGCELASPRRRLAAFAIDYLLLVVPTLIVALGWVAAAMRLQERPAFDALLYVMTHDETSGEQYRAALGHLAPLLVRLGAEGLPPGVEDAVRTGDLDRAVEALEATELLIAFQLGSEPAKVATRPGGKPFVRLPLAHHLRHLRPLATNPAEKCGLE